MTHLTQLELSMLADDALSPNEAGRITTHLDSCSACQARLAAVRDETRLLASALQMDTHEEAGDIGIPDFDQRMGLGGFAVANIVTGVVIWLAQFLWKTLFGELAVDVVSWVTSVYLPNVYELTSTAALYFLNEGMVMIDTYLGFVVGGVLILTTLSVFLMYRRSQVTIGVCLLGLAFGTLVVPTPSNALEVRRGEGVVTIAESETVDDTLLVAAETILIEGTVTGDVVAAGRRIDVSGTVGGNLLTFADSVKVRGNVGGYALGAADFYELSGAMVGGDLWATGDNITVDNTARVGRNATVAAQSVYVEGGVSKDLYAFAETVELSGELGRNLEAFASRLRLLGDAHVGGNVRIRSADEDRLHRDDSVRVDGEIQFEPMPELEKRNRYATVEFYLWQVARLIAAFLVGLALLWLVPGFRSVFIGSGMEGLKTAGIGFLTLVSVPVLVLLVAVTLVGLPLALIVLAAWVVAVYLANIVVAAIVGRMLLRQSDGLALTLLAGLAVVLVAVNLPFIGGIVNFVLTLIGLGLIVQYLMAVVPTAGSPRPVQV